MTQCSNVHTIRRNVLQRSSGYKNSGVADRYTEQAETGHSVNSFGRLREYIVLLLYVAGNRD
jgi:hypothetical protein